MQCITSFRPRGPGHILGDGGINSVDFSYGRKRGGGRLSVEWSAEGRDLEEIIDAKVNITLTLKQHTCSGGESMFYRAQLTLHDAW